MKIEKPVLGRIVAHDFVLLPQPSRGNSPRRGDGARSRRDHRARCARQVHSRRDHVHGACTVARSPTARWCSASEHREISGKAPGKISLTGAYPRARVMVRRLRTAAQRSLSASGGLR
jgi:hypothetical protein